MAFANRARRRVQKKGAVIRLAIVVAGCAEAQRPGQNQKRWRKRPPAMTCVDQGRIKRREVGSPLVELSFEGSKSGVDAESAQKGDDRHNLNPPRIPPQRAAKTADLNNF